MADTVIVVIVVVLIILALFWLFGSTKGGCCGNLKANAAALVDKAQAYDPSDIHQQAGSESQQFEAGNHHSDSYGYGGQVCDGFGNCHNPHFPITDAQSQALQSMAAASDGYPSIVNSYPYSSMGAYQNENNLNGGYHPELDQYGYSYAGTQVTAYGPQVWLGLADGVGGVGGSLY